MTDPLAGDPRLRTWDRPADRVRADLDRRVPVFVIGRRCRVRHRPRSLRRRMSMLRRRCRRCRTRVVRRRAAKIAQLQRQVYGVEDLVARAAVGDRVTVAISYRDAQDRAEKIQNESEALALLATAERSGDELLARAVGGWAIDRGYQQVADTFLATRPGQARALAELQQTQTPLNVADMWEFVLPKPAEIAALSDASIATLAAAAASLR